MIDGQSIGTFYSYRFLGLDPSNGLPLFDDYKDRQHLLEGKTLRPHHATRHGAQR